MSKSDKFKDNQHCSVKDFWRYPEEAEKHRGDSRRVSTENIPLTDQSSKDNKSTHKSSQNKNTLFSRLCSFIWRPSLREQPLWEWVKILASGALAGVLAVIFTWRWNDLSTEREAQLYRQQLVVNYINSVKELILDEYHEAGKKPDIGHQEIRTFIKAKTATTIINLDNDKKQLNKLINFLRGANIGFRPNEPEAIRLLERKLNNGIEDPEDYTLSLLEGINLSYAKMNNISEICFPKTRWCFVPTLNDKIIWILKRLGLETENPSIDLKNGMLKNTDLTNAKLNGVVLPSADLSNARFYNSRMKRANLIGANLENAHLKGTKLNGAILNQSNLRNADLTGAKLNNAKLRGADIRGALFHVEGGSSSLASVDWTYSIYKEHLDNDRNDSHFPEGFIKEKKCMIRIQDDNRVFLSESKSEECLEKANQIEHQIRPFRRNKNLNDINFSEIDLNGDQYHNLKDFTESDLSKAIFTNAKLKNAYLRGANLQEAKLQGADLTEAKLHLANLKDIEVDNNTKIERKWLLVAKILNPELRHQSLEEELTDLSKEDLQLAYLPNSKLEETTLRNANLQGANLQGANLTNADLTEAKLEPAFLEEDNPLYREKIPVNLNRAILVDATLKKANMQEADLTRANLKKAKLQKANLTNTDLRKADLTEAHLDGADLTNADLRGANLTDAYLTGAKGANLQESILCNTTLPNGTKQSLNCPKNDHN